MGKTKKKISPNNENTLNTEGYVESSKLEKYYYVRNLAPLENFIIIAIVAIPSLIFLERASLNNGHVKMNSIHILIATILIFFILSLLSEYLVKKSKIKGIYLNKNNISIDTRPLINTSKKFNFSWINISKIEVLEDERFERPGELKIFLKDNTHRVFSLRRYELPKTKELNDIFDKYLDSAR